MVDLSTYIVKNLGTIKNAANSSKSVIDSSKSWIFSNTSTIKSL